MKRIIIAFDVDGTLVSTEGKPNTRIIDLLKILHSFKNTKIVVWSGGGEEYAKNIVRQLRMEKYVDRYASKIYQGLHDGKHVFFPGWAPDIAIDDIQDCELGLLNLIVKEK